MSENRTHQAEIVIVCPTDGESREMIKHLSGAYFVNVGPLPAKLGTIGRYSVLCCTTGKGQEETASALTQILERIRPRWVFLVGIAGGFPEQRVHRGDLVVARTIHSFDYGKLTSKGFIRRPELDFNADRGLLSWSNFVMGDSKFDWRSYIELDKPKTHNAEPVAHSDCYIASSNKVVDNPDHIFYTTVKAAFPEIHAVEMEGSGAASSIRLEQSERAVGLLMIRGISDEPSVAGNAGSDQRIAWRSYAAAVASAFTRRLIESLPVGGDGLRPHNDSDGSTTQILSGRLALETDGSTVRPASASALPWPSHEVVLNVHVHTKKRNALVLGVHFTKNIPGYQDTHGMSVEIPHRRSLITEIIGRLLGDWKAFLASSGRAGSGFSLQKAGQQLLKSVLGPFDMDNAPLGDRLSGLRRLLTDQRLRIRVLTEEVYIPWDLMHIAGVGFLGYLHCIETGIGSKFSAVHDEHKRSDLFNFGKTPFLISEQVGNPVRQEHEMFRSSLSQYRFADIPTVERKDVATFAEAIKHNASDQLVYFSFIHSTEKRADAHHEQRFMIGDSSFRAYELRNWLSKTSLPYRPLLFLNLNESNIAGDRLRIIDQYEDFYREFFLAGMSALVGPEIPMPPAFATQFAKVFCQEMFKGSPPSAVIKVTVGDCLWAAKQKLYSDGHLYGLLYSYYLVRDIAFEETVSFIKAPEASRPFSPEKRREGGEE